MLVVLLTCVGCGYILWRYCSCFHAGVFQYFPSSVVVAPIVVAITYIFVVFVLLLRLLLFILLLLLLLLISVLSLLLLFPNGVLEVSRNKLLFSPTRCANVSGPIVIRDTLYMLATNVSTSEARGRRVR